MSFFTKLLTTFLGDPHERRLKEFWPVVAQINAVEDSLLALSDDALAAKTKEFRERLGAGLALDALLPEAFAVVREASRRVLGLRHFDVQLIGGIVLHRGGIAEMKTGEGKTLMSTLAAYLNALEGKGVYLVTVNDYLARRDSEWMGKIFRFLGLTVGLIQSGMPSEARIAAYSSDITYGTNNEFGFDYLRDNLVFDAAQMCQARRHFAIIDEVDSILIDEARTPLIISGPVAQSVSRYTRIADIVRAFVLETHFTVEEKHKNAVLTEAGIVALEKALGLDNLYAAEHMEIPHIAVQCLRALHLFRVDVDYVVKDGEVVIVDEFTGRLMEGRRYSDGLHQSIEAIEGVLVQEESQTLASVTFQNYFRLFPKLAGMTGTALTEEAEFGKIYGLEVFVIPTHRPVSREDLPDLVYKSKDEKYRAIVRDIKEAHEKGQPVLVGTISIEISELLSKLLTKERIVHSVLNAKQHEKEAEIVANAGQKGRVTIATNMAGRGTDIALGEGVCECGGLYVIGSERHESRRIDNQLRGRSGRQGDPGLSRFYVSLEDELMRLFGSERIRGIMDRLGMPDDTPIEHSMISKSIARAQTKVEQYHFGIRKQILQYDDVLNQQRENIYRLRRDVLVSKGLDKTVNDLISKWVETEVSQTFEKQPQLSHPGYGEFVARVGHVFPIQNIEEVMQTLISKPGSLVTHLSETLYQFYLFRKNESHPDVFETFVVRRILLMTLDRKWIDHLHNMESLREGIGLRAYGQRDPLVEYKLESYDMFLSLKHGMAEESLSAIVRATIVTESASNDLRPDLPDDVLEARLREVGAEETSLPSPALTGEKLGRNDLCSCGSGRKSKKCCQK
jgi:preprotein translocase subunit SecA